MRGDLLMTGAQENTYCKRTHSVVPTTMQKCKRRGRPADDISKIGTKFGNDAVENGPAAVSLYHVGHFPALKVVFGIGKQCRCVHSSSCVCMCTFM